METIDVNVNEQVLNKDLTETEGDGQSLADLTPTLKFKKKEQSLSQQGFSVPASAISTLKNHYVNGMSQYDNEKVRNSQVI